MDSGDPSLLACILFLRGIALSNRWKRKSRSKLGFLHRTFLFIILMGVGGIGFADSGELPDSLRNIVHIFRQVLYTHFFDT